MPSLKPSRVMVLLSTLAMITINTLAVVLPLNGRSTAQISDSFNSLFTPAGYVFSIWGLIYLAMIAFAVYQLLPMNKENTNFEALSWWVVLSNLANSVWILLWRYEFVNLSLAIMLSLLASLLVIYRRVEHILFGWKSVEYWFTKAPFSLYLGWISVATVANAAVVLINSGWNGLGLDPMIWTVIMMGVACALAVSLLLGKNDYIFAGVIIWSLVGIAVKQQAILPLVVVAVVYVGVVLSAVVYMHWKDLGRLLARRKNLDNSL